MPVPSGTALRACAPYVALLAAMACGGGGGDAHGDAGRDGALDVGPDAGPADTTARLALDSSAGIFDAPFPIAHRAREDGSLVVADFPNPRGIGLLDQLVTLLERSRAGFSLNAAVWVPFDGPVDAARLPSTPRASLEDGSTVFLVDVDASSPERGRRIALDVAFKAAAETHSPANLLVALPFQGVVMRPRTTYALVVRAGLGDAEGDLLRQPEALRAVLAGETPEGDLGARAVADFAPLRAWLAEEGEDAATVAAATVFTTGDPTREARARRADVAARTPPAITSVTLLEEFDTYCAVGARTELPVFQRGPKPYGTFPSGELVEDESGALVVQERDAIDLVVAVPKATMPEAGWPLLLYGNGGGGQARQVVDRTLESEMPDLGLGPTGRGPALFLAHRGFASVGFVAPLAHERHPAGAEGEIDFFNVANLAAFRGNIQQGALDFTTVIQVMKGAALDADVCPGSTAGASGHTFDASHFAMWGHSTGSTIGSGVIPLEPDVRVGMLSGAGGSWIYNVALADSPFSLRDAAKLVLGYVRTDGVDIHDTALSLFQHMMEPTEVMSLARGVAAEPFDGGESKHLLLMEGVVDTYHYPRMVNAYAMSVGADLVAPAAEETAEEDYRLVGRGVVEAPAGGNRTGADGEARTVVTLQRAQREGVDGHYVPFEWADMKYRYSCFLASWFATGTPTVYPPSDDPFAPCPF